jgi:hypothetical protein
MLSRLVSFFKHSWGGMKLSPLGTSATNWPILPSVIDENGALDETRIGRGNGSIQRKPAAMSLLLP